MTLRRRRVIPRTPPVEYVPRSRTSDPATSHAAGAEFEDTRIVPNSPRHTALRPFEYVTDGLTAPELQEEVGGGLDNKETIRKRVSELEDGRLILWTGVTRPNYRSARKRQCRIYILTDLGLRALRRLEAGKTWPPA